MFCIMTVKYINKDAPLILIIFVHSHNLCLQSDYFFSQAENGCTFLKQYNRLLSKSGFWDTEHEADVISPFCEIITTYWKAHCLKPHRCLKSEGVWEFDEPWLKNCHINGLSSPFCIGFFSIKCVESHLLVCHLSRDREDRAEGTVGKLNQARLQNSLLLLYFEAYSIFIKTDISLNSWK